MGPGAKQTVHIKRVQCPAKADLVEVVTAKVGDFDGIRISVHEN